MVVKCTLLFWGGYIGTGFVTAAVLYTVAGILAQYSMIGYHIVETILNVTQKMKDQGLLVPVCNCNLKEKETGMNQN